MLGCSLAEAVRKRQIRLTGGNRGLSGRTLGWGLETTKRGVTVTVKGKHLIRKYYFA